MVNLGVNRHEKYVTKMKEVRRWSHTSYEHLKWLMRKTPDVRVSTFVQRNVFRKSELY